MLEIFEERDLSDGGTGHSIILLFQSDLLDGDHLSGLLVECLVDDSVGSLSEFF